MATGKPSRYKTNTKINSALHSYEVSIRAYRPEWLEFYGATRLPVSGIG